MMTTKEMINEVHALVTAAVKAENERIVNALEHASVEYEQYDFHAVGITNALIKLVEVKND